MFEFLKFFQWKPSDLQIRLIRILWAGILLVVLIFWWNDFSLAWGIPEEGKYVLGVFPLISLIRGVLDPAWFHRKTWRWIMVGSGVLMIFCGWFLIVPVTSATTETATTTTSSGAVSVADILSETSSEVTTPVAVGFYFALLGWILLFSGLLLANKNITRKNEKHGDVIKKIRV